LPGYTYQYQIRVRMKNPNFNRTKEVREPSDAKIEFLEGPWVTLPDTLVMPPESFLYAYDTREYLKKAEAMIDESKRNFVMKQLVEHLEMTTGRRAAVQVQQWMPQVRATGDKIEPVGAWVVSELPVAVGEYIGRRQLVRLPLWSSGAQNYVLRDLAAGVRVAGPGFGKTIPESQQPKGWPVNFRTRSVLVDFEGGEVRKQFGAKEIKDESATELLILRPDGKLVLKSSLDDMADKTREARETTWDEWLARVKDRRDVIPGAAPGAADPANPFNR
ncbi:MAG: hypothetical protein ACRC7O_16265, partial [Fimbriiglobus sp.]